MNEVLVCLSTYTTLNDMYKFIRIYTGYIFKVCQSYHCFYPLIIRHIFNV